jgi:hypothetical protein
VARKRLLSILTTVVLATGLTAGPAMAVELGTEDLNVELEDGVSAELGDVEAELDDDGAKVTTKKKKETKDDGSSDDSSPLPEVEAEVDGDGATAKVGDTTVSTKDATGGGSDDGDGGSDGTKSGGGDTSTSGGKSTDSSSNRQARRSVDAIASASPPFALRASSVSGVSPIFPSTGGVAGFTPNPTLDYGLAHGGAGSIPAPEVAAPASGELAPEVAARAEDADMQVAMDDAAAPLSADTPMALRLLAAMLVAGVGLTWHRVSKEELG